MAPSSLPTRSPRVLAGPESYFACEHFDLEPDVLCMGKAITGGYGGLGASATQSTVT